MTLSLNFSRSSLEIAVSQKLLVWLMWNEKVANQLDTGPNMWHCSSTSTILMTWPCIFKFKVWTNFTPGMGWLIDMEQKGHESIIHVHDHDLCVTLEMWLYVQDSDRAGLRRWCAIDISSYQLRASSKCSSALMITAKSARSQWVFGLSKLCS